MAAKESLLDSIYKKYGDNTAGLVDDFKKYILKNSQRSSKSVKPLGRVVASLSNVSKTYRSGKNTVEAVKEVSFDIKEGEIVALVGSSGSGKSSILNLIGGLDHPSSGIITIDGQDLSKLSDNKLSGFRNQTIGFVFQFFYLQPFLNLSTNIEIPLMFGGTKKQARHEQSAKFINAVGLDDRAEHLPKELSGGQIQRTAIARALVNNPKLVLADEPTGNLDRKNGDQIMDLFEHIRTEFNTAILIVTHDEKTAARADRVIELEDGSII